MSSDTQIPDRAKSDPDIAAKLIAFRRRQSDPHHLRERCARLEAENLRLIQEVIGLGRARGDALAWGQREAWRRERWQCAAAVATAAALTLAALLIARLLGGM